MEKEIFLEFSSWPLDNKEEKEYSAPDSFLFTLTNIYNIQPTIFPRKNEQREIKCYFDNGPLFGIGTDLVLYSDFSNKGGQTNVENTYPAIFGKGRNIFTGDPNNKNSRFKIKEIEIFKLYK